MKHRLRFCLWMVICIWLLQAPAWAMDSFVTLIEYTGDGQVYPLSSDQLRFDVDINSVIDVHFHPEALSSYCQGTKPAYDSLREEADALRQLLNTSHDHVKTYVEGIDDLYKQLQIHPTPALEAKFRQQLADQGTLIESLLDLLEPVVGSEQLEQALRTPDPLYGDVFALLGQHITDIQSRLNAQTKQIIQENQLLMNVWCIHQSTDNTSVAVHLNHYDNLAAGSPEMIDKISLTPEDQEQLRTNLRFYDEMAQMMKNFQGHTDGMKGLLQELRDEVVSNLNELQETMRTEPLQQALTALREELIKASALPQAADLQASVAEMMKLYQQIKDLQTRYDTLVDFFRKPQAADLLQYYSDLMQNLEGFAAQLDTVIQSNTVQSIVKAAVQFNTSLEQTGKSIPAALAEKAAALTEYAEKWGAGLAAQLEQNNTDHFYADLIGAFKSLGSRLSYTSTVTAVPADTAIPAAANKVVLSDAEPTSIDIPRTLRRSGDIYTLYVQVYRGNSLLIRQEYSFRVQPFGVYSAWDSGLIFVKCSAQEAFQPSTGLSWILHYRPRPKEGWYVPFFNPVFNPGIGLNAVMFLNDTQIQYGLGIAATLFNDLFQIGGGINLQRKDNEGRGYIFIGASLLDLLQSNSQPGIRSGPSSNGN